jgi:hypothetical protein
MMMMNSVTTTTMTMTTTMGVCFSAGLGRADGCAERVFSPRNILMTLLLCFVSILKVSSLGRRREISCFRFALLLLIASVAKWRF